MAVGANLEEAKAGSSKREFIRYVEISLREAREAAYWLRILVALELEFCISRVVGKHGKPERNDLRINVPNFE